MCPSAGSVSVTVLDAAGSVEVGSTGTVSILSGVPLQNIAHDIVVALLYVLISRTLRHIIWARLVFSKPVVKQLGYLTPVTKSLDRNESYPMVV